MTRVDRIEGATVETDARNHGGIVTLLDMFVNLVQARWRLASIRIGQYKNSQGVNP